MNKIVTPERVKEIKSESGISDLPSRTKEETKLIFSKINKLTMMTASMMSSKLDFKTLGLS